MSVRKCTYRDIAGWTLSGSPRGSNHRLSIFFEHESAARRTFERFVDDPTYVMTTEDFEP